MAIQYANLTYSFVVDDYVDLPAGVPPGQLAYVSNTGLSYYSTNGTWKLLATGSGSSRPSFDNPPASPSAYDDEFDATTLDAKWTLSSTGTTNPITSGTVNPLSNLTTPIYDLVSCPSWIMFQSDNSSQQVCRITQSLTPATQCTVFAKFSINNRIISAVNEGNIEITFGNSADSNENVFLSISQQGSGSGYAAQITVENNGVFSFVAAPTITEKVIVGNFYGVLWKDGNVYHAGWTHGNNGGFTYLGSVTKTGVTTFDRLSLRFLTANETPSSIEGCDFIRYYPSITYALMN